MKIKILLVLSTIIMSFLYLGCQKEPESSAGATADLKAGAGAIKIAVLADPHYMAPSLLVADGPAFQMYLAQDPKLLVQSRDIFIQAILQINQDKPDLLLIPGDMTKDGELISHQEVISLLNENLDHRIKVLVLPGNHDINNPDAVIFNGASTTPTPSVSSSEFVSLYEDFGYGQAISRDAASLSYVAEPYKNLRVIAIDATIPSTATAPTTNGYLKPETMTWIAAQVADAEAKHMQIITMSHHLMVPHFANEPILYPGYVVDNWVEASNFLADQGLKINFCGHFHSEDITQYANASGGFLDVETGSPLTYPLPYRIGKYQNNGKIEMETKFIRGISYDGVPIDVYAKSFLSNHMDFLFFQMLKSYMTPVPEPIRSQVAAQGAPLLRKAYMAHNSGDESITEAEMAELINFRDTCPVPGIGPLVYGGCMSLWTDLPIADNYLQVIL